MLHRRMWHISWMAISNHSRVNAELLSVARDAVRHCEQRLRQIALFSLACTSSMLAKWCGCHLCCEGLHNTRVKMFGIASKRDQKIPFLSTGCLRIRDFVLCISRTRSQCREGCGKHIDLCLEDVPMENRCNCGGRPRSQKEHEEAKK